MAKEIQATDVAYVLLLDGEGKLLGAPARRSGSTWPTAREPAERSWTGTSTASSRRWPGATPRAGPGLDFATGDAPAESKRWGGSSSASRPAGAGVAGRQTRSPSWSRRSCWCWRSLVLHADRRRLNRMGRFAERVAAGDLGDGLADDGPDGRDRPAGARPRGDDPAHGHDGRPDARTRRARWREVSGGDPHLQLRSRGSPRRSRPRRRETGATVAELRETFNQAAERAQAVIELAKRSEESRRPAAAVRGEHRRDGPHPRPGRGHLPTMMAWWSGPTRSARSSTRSNDLAEQSNVLALNAAIEAAQGRRAGPRLRGGRARSALLAERSKDSTSQVRAILQDIEQASREALGASKRAPARRRPAMELANAGRRVHPPPGRRHRRVLDRGQADRRLHPPAGRRRRADLAGDAGRSIAPSTRTPAASCSSRAPPRT